MQSTPSSSASIRQGIQGYRVYRYTPQSPTLHLSILLRLGHRQALLLQRRNCTLILHQLHQTQTLNFRLLAYAHASELRWNSMDDVGRESTTCQYREALRDKFRNVLLKRALKGDAKAWYERECPDEAKFSYQGLQEALSGWAKDRTKTVSNASIVAAEVTAFRRIQSEPLRDFMRRADKLRRRCPQEMVKYLRNNLLMFMRDGEVDSMIKTRGFRSREGHVGTDDGNPETGNEQCPRAGNLSADVTFVVQHSVADRNMDRNREEFLPYKAKQSSRSRKEGEGGDTECQLAPISVHAERAIVGAHKYGDVFEFHDVCPSVWGNVPPSLQDGNGERKRDEPVDMTREMPPMWTPYVVAGAVKEKYTQPEYSSGDGQGDTYPKFASKTLEAHDKAAEKKVRMVLKNPESKTLPKKPEGEDRVSVPERMITDEREEDVVIVTPGQEENRDSWNILLALFHSPGKNSFSSKPIKALSKGYTKRFDLAEQMTKWTVDISLPQLLDLAPRSRSILEGLLKKEDKTSLKKARIHDLASTALGYASLDPAAVDNGAAFG
ncbi:hypothetical protein MKZ38_005910 [Zalerion maritima]|uniref:Retrotransposon gag domain-containing protein n=1 Tax=Zalerion maritima TaxID=339359 RepID=A0AAD5RPQ5_9PEZI|nr:hypothetical protein MKZ38_005910 [Zalerion maritima]